MILVLTGTHEQPFGRLLRVLPQIALREPVLAQACVGEVHAPGLTVVRFLTPSELQARLAQARIVVCHAGPATVFDAVDAGHVPIVVPRSGRFGEHVDDHQVQFVRRLAGSVHVVLDPAELPAAIDNHPHVVAGLVPPRQNEARTQAFCTSLQALCVELARKRPTTAARRDTLTTFRRWMNPSR